MSDAKDILSDAAEPGIHDAFVAACRRDPDAVAILGDARRRSYGDLQVDVRALAGALAAQGVGQGDHVALYATRGAEAITAMLACLALGAVYAPMDPGFAPEQLALIAQDLPFRAALAPRALADEAAGVLGAVPLLVIGEASGPVDTLPVVAPDDPACILYTSGTTGRPKGVILPHRAVITLALAQPELGMGPGDVSLHASTIACDGALYEVFGALLAGAAVAVVEGGTPALDRIAAVMTGARVTVASWYAGLHHLMIEHHLDAFATLRLSIGGGDVMSVPMARRLLAAYPDLRLVNDFGPTETCVHSLCHRVTAADLTAGAIPVGHVLPGEEAVLLDDDLQPVAPGEAGQLAIGGAKLALGYHGRSDLTAERFIPDPRPGRDGRLYLTGDMLRPRDDGGFDFLGRADRQVKLAGRRVEVDGVEAVLRGLPGVRDAVVEYLRAPVPQLVAFVIPAAPEAPEAFRAGLRDLAAGHLPRDVIPRRIELCEAFP
ncbi:amino acid adenylation domain-containing protein [Pseudooceanicola sp. LIPI14-2-Ac024]|uniref:amino acid adenylation domain-containing protein n=1 Tax=Pseudooceanicola sp. LIPI14-2-Ac024 TaxID=3344875 RepID=UPI0035D06F7B